MGFIEDGYMRKCIIFAAYRIKDKKMPLEIISKGDFIICADGGQRHAEEMGIIPDVILGDFDSSPYIYDSENSSATALNNNDAYNDICKEAGTKGPEIICLPTEKDDTDTAAAVKLCIAKGYKEFYIFGGLGGRPDHTIGNIVLLKFLADKGCQGVIVGDKNEMTMIQNDSINIEKGKYKYLSVFAFGGDAKGVTLSGVKYPLHDYTLANNYPLGVSNEITGDIAKIMVKRGTLLIIQADE